MNNTSYNYKILPGSSDEILFIIKYIEGVLKGVQLKVKNLDFDAETEELVVDYAVADAKFDICKKHSEMIKDTFINIVSKAAAISLSDAIPANDG